VSAFRAKSVPVSVKVKVGAALACKLYQDKQNTHKYPWQSFHFSRWNADKGFQEVKKDLEAYKIIDKDWPFQVQTPGAEQFPCYQNYYD
jgi:hypothetical protein